MQDVQDLLLAIERVVTADVDRKRSRDAALQGATRVAPALPWTHRTGRPAKGDWREIFRNRRLDAAPAETVFERNLGHDRAVYFFVGSCAYPEGLAVLLFSFTRGSVARSTFNPYDTGFLKHVAFPRRPAGAWDDTAKTQHIQSTMGWTRDLHAFGGPYLAAHFRDPIDYVRRPQDGVPDFEPYHGLDGGDRRAWTIEARLHDDVTIEPNGQELLEIWLEDQSLLRELPVDFRRYARIKRDGMTLAESVAQRIERKISEVSP